MEYKSVGERNSNGYLLLVFSFCAISLVILPQSIINLTVSLVTMAISIAYLTAGVKRSDFAMATVTAALLLLGTIGYINNGYGVDLGVLAKLMVVLCMLLTLNARVIEISRCGLQSLRAFVFVAILMNLCAQAVLSLNIAPFDGFLMSHFYDGTDSQDKYYQGGADLLYGRIGGLIPNGNQSAKAVLILYCIYLSAAIGGRRNAFFYVLLVMVGASVSITGSRTAIIIYSLITGLYFQRLGGGKSLGLKLIAYAGVIFLLALLFLLSGSGERLASGSYDDSLGYKVSYLANYLQYALRDNVFALFFGNGLLSERMPESFLNVGGNDFGFDSDVGFLIYVLGFPATVLLLVNILGFFGRGNNRLWIMPLMLWVVSSSLFFNIRSALLFIALVATIKLSEKYSERATAMHLVNSDRRGLVGYSK